MAKNEVEEFRRKFDLSCTQLGKLLGISHQVVSSFERGVRKLPPARRRQMENLANGNFRDRRAEIRATEDMVRSLRAELEHAQKLLLKLRAEHGTPGVSRHFE